MPADRHSKNLNKRALWSGVLISVMLVSVQQASAEPQVILNPRSYTVSQPGQSPVTVPAVETIGSAKDFYDFYSASSHTGYEQLGRSLIFLHRDVSQNPPPVSLIITHGIDRDTSGQSQPSAEVHMDLTNLPATSVITQADDNATEFRKVNPTTVEGRWVFANNTDGGVIGGIPEDQDWSIDLTIDQLRGMTSFEYFYANGQNISFDTSEPVNIAYDAPPSSSTYSVEGYEDVPVTVCATIVSSNGGTSTFRWKWEDNAGPHYETGSTTSEVETVCSTYTYPDDGIFQVDLEATDGTGTATVITRVFINNTDPANDNVEPLHDEFDGEWKSCLWDSYQRYGGDTYREGDAQYDPGLNTVRNNRLDLKVPANYLAGMDWETGLESTYMLGGNFDVQVDFHLPDAEYWTNLDMRGLNVLFVELMANDAGARRRQVRNSRLNPDTTEAVFNPHLWVANHNNDMVTQIDTDNPTTDYGKVDRGILGQYSTGNNPSRTSVDLLGNVWINHRCDSSIWRIKAGECTPPSCTEAEVNANYKDSFTTAYSNGQCNGGGVAVDKNNDPWVGFLNARVITKLDQSTGQVVSATSVPGRVYGVAVDVNDFIWVDQMWDSRISKVDALTGVKIADYRPTDGLCFNPYGIAVDAYGKIWNGMWGNCPYITRFDPVTETFDRFISPNGADDLNHNRGVAADNQGLVWTVSSTRDKLSVFNMETGAFVNSYNTCDSPSGVALDRNNRVWVTCINGHVWMHDRDGSPLAQINTGSGTYSYSDMTGYQLRNFGSDAWKESFTASQSIQEDAYFISSVENNYGGGIEDGVGGGEAVDPTQAPVQNLSTVSANLYELNRIRFSELYYTDRLFRILSQTSEIEGLWGLRTPNNDRLRKEDTLVTLDANQDLDVYVAYDAKASRLPAWLNDHYTVVDDDNDSNQDMVTTTNTASEVYKLYKRRYNSGDQIVLGGNLASLSTGTSTARSCREILERNPLAPSGEYTIDNGTSGPITAFCDMESDGGVGHTAVLLTPGSLATNSDQADYEAACQAIGMDIVVPRSKGHAEQLVNHFGVLPNIVNVKAVDVTGDPVDNSGTYYGAGYAGWIGHCRNPDGTARDCSFYLGDFNNGNCTNVANQSDPTPFFPYVFPFDPSARQKQLTLTLDSATPSCPLGSWYSNNTVTTTGRVMCSPNDTFIEPAKSCDEIAFRRSQHNTQQGISGVYTLSTISGQTYEAYCDMHLEGGGWTQSMRLANNGNRMNYDASYWTDGTLYNETEPNLINEDGKFRSFLSVPFDELAVGMTQNIGLTPGENIPRTNYTYVTMPHTASSMLSMFQAGERQLSATLAGTGTTGRNAWKSLIANSSLQNNCNRQGVNIGNNYARVRVGIVGNNENNCGSPDSRIGIGGRGSACGQDNNNVSGNTATCGGDNGNQNLRAASTLLSRKHWGALVGDWRFNGDNLDRSGYGNHGNSVAVNRPFCASNSGPNFGPGVSSLAQDDAADFDGCDDWWQVPSSASLESESVTIAMWVYIDDALWANDGNNNWVSLLRKGWTTSGATTGYDIVLEENGQLAFDTSHTGVGGHRWWPGRTNLPRDEWIHLTLSYDNTSKVKSFWLNGELIDSTVLPDNHGGIIANGAPLQLSNAPNQSPAMGQGAMPGRVDNLKIYNGPIPQDSIERLAGSRTSSQISNYFAYFRPTAFSEPPPTLSSYTIIEDPVKDAADNDKDVLSTEGRLRVTRSGSIWSFFYADEITSPTVWKRMGDPMDLGDQDARIRVRTRLDPFWHSGPVNNPGGAISLQYDNYRVNSADEVIGAPVEVCNGLDDDCDGRIDENYIGKYEPCNTGKPGICADGYLVCEMGTMVCKQINQPTVEICDEIDNDCNGVIDDYVEGGDNVDGDYVSTGEACTDDSETGPCRNGQYVCDMGVMVCQGVVPAEPEICDGIDNDCDGEIDNTDDHIFAEVNHFLTAKQRTVPFIWPRPVIGMTPFFSDDGDASNDFARYDGTSSDPNLVTVYLSNTTQVHALRKARIVYYLDPSLADAANPRGRYVLWLTHGRAEGAQGEATAAYGLRHSLSAPLSVVLNDSNESSISAGNASNTYQNFVVTSEAGSTGGVALGSLPSAEPWTLELSATFDGDLDGWELFNPETGVPLELNPSQKLTLENRVLPAGVLITADAGQACAVPGAQGICENGTGVCVGGTFSCNQTVTPLPHELCDGLDNDCNGLTDEDSSIVYAKVEVRQQGTPEVDDWLWAPTIDNGISPESTLNFQPEAGDDRIGSPDVRSVEDMMVSLQKLDSSVVTFHLDQRPGQGTISMPLLHGARTEGLTGAIPALTNLEFELEEIGSGLPRELFTSFYDDRTGSEADAAPSDYEPAKFTFKWNLRRNITTGTNFERESDGLVVRDIAESYNTLGSSYKLNFKQMGNLKDWEFYRPFRPVIMLDEDEDLEVRTSLVSDIEALCVIQDHPLEECLGSVSRYVCIDGQVTCQINPAGCCKDLDGDGFYGYDPLTCDTGTDCDDDDAAINPGATEVCDGIDNDCNGFINGRNDCTFLDAGCNVIDEEFPEEGASCEGPLDADCNEVTGGGGYDCVREADGSCRIKANGTCDLFVVSSVGECTATVICRDGSLLCDNTSGPTEEVCDGLDNDCDGEVDASYFEGPNDMNAPEQCGRDGERCGPRECDYKDICSCVPGKIGTDACDCQAALVPEGALNFSNPCRGNTYYDGESCVAVCTEDGDCEDGFVCDMTTRACVEPAVPTGTASQNGGEVKPQGCSSTGGTSPSAPFGLAALLILGGFCFTRRRKIH